MPVTTPPGEDAQAPGARRRRWPLLLALALLALLALAGGLAAALGTQGLRALLGGAPAPQEAAVAEAEAPPPGADLAVLPFEDMIVNITATTESGRRTSRFLKLDLALVYDRAKDGAGQVETRHIYLRDAFQDYLRQLTDRDLDGTLGLVTVKGELLRRARAVSGSDAPHELLVQGLVVQ